MGSDNDSRVQGSYEIKAISGYYHDGWDEEKVLNMELKFNIHNLFKFKMMGENKRCLRHFAQDYSYFITDEEIESELDIVVSDFTPSNNECYLLDQRYYIKENYIFCKDNHKAVKWSFCIKDLENKPTIYFKGNIFSEIFLRNYIIEPMIAFKLAQKGYSLLHAAGVALNDKGFVFPAGKGVGKTTTMMNLMGDGGTYLSNEPIIISNDGMVYSFPSYIHFFHYNLKGNPHFSEKLKFRHKLELELKHFIYLLSLKYCGFYLNINPKDIFGDVGGKYPLRSLILLTKTNKNKVEILRDIDKKSLVERLIIINKFETQYFMDCLMAYSYLFPEKMITNFWQTVGDNLVRALSKTPCHEIEIPFKYDRELYREIYKFIEREDSY